MTRQEVLALGYLIAGLALGVIAVIADLMGGPAYLHALSWVGGFAGGYGLITIIKSARQRRRHPLGTKDYEPDTSNPPHLT
ncbi:hypothetical protein [Pseudoclavibacter sp. AY1H1]|uniref:hypothetical protein n=1 Tax=Pseudoclavibacter sp. AY1H1 TaxID=2080584 RepID=UPI000CE73D0F|nr:hypothetical protein [Pseudoclavibacter sp. AY1H1]PPF37107.1 hypothetical protein C5E05_09165 [Pseudoclavibacter sp. AY1H1]